MKFPRYTVRALLDVLLWLPLIAQALLFLLLLLSGYGVYGTVPFIAAIFAMALLAGCFFMGRGLILRTWSNEVPPRPESTFCRRYLPVLLALAFTLLVAVAGLFIPSNENRAVFSAFGNIFALAHFPSSALLLLLFIFVPPTPWIMALPLAIYAAYGFGMASAFRTLRIPRSDQWNGVVCFGLAAMVMGFIIGRSVTLREGVLVGGRDDYFADANEIEPYHPYEKDNRLVRVPEPGLTISENYPVLDGATAAYPVYAAAVQAVYLGAEEKGVYSVLRCSKTSEAYQKLFDGQADIIFALQPSQAQLAAAKTAGVTLHFTPIAKEAFIFFVNAGNPVNGLTTAQVRAIYTKAIANWSEVGGADEKIMAFQRPPNSGSQTALEELVMKGETPAPAPREEVVGSMGGVMQRVATYHNTRSALGYSFRYYATTMNPIAGIKLLAIDGFTPTPETIRSGAYPYTVELYAVTAGSKNPNTQKLIDWFLSPAGQKMIEETGYVGVK